METQGPKSNATRTQQTGKNETPRRKTLKRKRKYIYDAPTQPDKPTNLDLTIMDDREEVV
jgi:hypothetical protein